MPIIEHTHNHAEAQVNNEKSQYFFSYVQVSKVSHPLKLCPDNHRVRSEGTELPCLPEYTFHFQTF